MRSSILSLAGAVAFLVVTANGVAQEQEAYHLGAGDQIRVTVYGHDDLTGEFEVDGAGRISFPLIGDVDSANRTTVELASLITEALKPDYLMNPRVSVEIFVYRPFYIMGQVNDPGGYPYVSGMTVTNAVAVAGGYTSRARKDEIRITRTDNGEQIIITVSSDTQVRPDDIIDVRERFF